MGDKAQKINYLKYEEGYFLKRWRGRVPIALIFPENYEVGMSNLGFLTLYERLNSYEEIVCERVFFSEGEIRSLENNRPLRDFPLLLFSIPFEGSFVKALQILLKSGISFNPFERKETVLGGGIALWANPQPLSPFFDGFLLGEWEALEEKIVPLLIEYAYEKEKLLFALKDFPFFYAPLYFGKKRVKILKALLPLEPLLSRVLSERAEFGKSYLFEVSKGCGRACRFCLAGFIYRPPRRFTLEALLKKAELIPEGSKVGLIGLEFVDKEEVFCLGEALLKKKALLTFSSLRLEAINENFLKLLKETKSLAIAPETGSLKLKKVINKVIKPDEVFQALERLKETSIQKIKFYFMLGLPFESEEDLLETANFIKELLKKGYPFKFTFSFSFFVPKPHTPFQWAPFLGVKELERRRELLLKALSGVKGLKFESSKEALLQALLARGDEKLKSFLETLSQGKSLKRALNEVKDMEKYLAPPQERDFSFPWDFIDTGVSKEFLFLEWERARAQKETPSCRPSLCQACSACKNLTFQAS